jgi:hypothetical protein
MFPVDIQNFKAELADKVHASFSKSNQEQIPKALVVEILEKLELPIPNPSASAPRLLLHRLMFSGHKTLKGEVHPQEFRYDQKFESGVNLLLVPDNNVGKSSVMKTIKFALTGDNSDYDVDIKEWIQRIWLQFSIGIDEFTIYFLKNENFWKGILVLGNEESCLETLPEIPGKFFDVQGIEKIQEQLQQFFFTRLDLSLLSWTQQDSSVPGGIAMRRLSWKGFFQAMLIPDSSDQYLFSDPKHAMGNQDGLILSTFLGLRLVEPLNNLLVEKNLIERREKPNTEAI